MDKEGVRAMKKYSEDVEKTLDSLAPWLKRKKASRRLGAFGGKLKPGEAAVMLDGGESANNPLFKNAKIVRE